MNVVEIVTAETYSLRLTVLRQNTATKVVSFPEDDWPGVVHLGVRDDNGNLIATSSWVPRDCPFFEGQRAVQLRGMATAQHRQSSGVGGMLIEAGSRRFAEAGFDLMWARARDVALDFYTRHACIIVGDGFVDEATNLAHHVVVRQFAS